MSETIAADSIAEIMDFDMLAFGNAYYITDKSLCGGNSTSYDWNSFSEYDATVRKCFNTKCGKEDAPPDCFKGGLFCQHGAAECAVNLLQMCGKFVQKDWTKYVPFAACMETQYATIASSVNVGTDPNMAVINLTVSECAKTLDAEAVLDCFNHDALSIQMATAKATPPHPGTPFVQVTNKSGTFALKTNLLHAVCAAWEYNGGTLKTAKGCASIRRTLVV